MRVFFVLIFLPSIQLAAQDKFTYFDKHQKVVDKNDCHHFTVTKESYDEVDSIVSYYCDTKRIRSIAYVDSEGVSKGPNRVFHENGNLRTKALCHAFNFVDSLYEWYPNGSLHYVEYRGTADLPDRKLITYRNPSGNLIVKNGMGVCDRCRFEAFHMLGYTESGIVRSGVKDSVWTTYDADGSKINEDIYESGKFIAGTYFTGDGENVSYTTIEEMAVPKNGLASFYQFIAKNINYPKSARKQRVQGKVYVEFIIDNDGSITEVKCIKGIGGGCDEEAERVIASSAKWNPGRQRGRFVRQKMVLPINFHL